MHSSENPRTPFRKQQQFAYFLGQRFASMKSNQQDRYRNIEIRTGSPISAIPDINPSISRGKWIASQEEDSFYKNGFCSFV
ncbi:hypothetical protein JTE90_000853 [Oedothorax gibbosus]|uniref:Uncharacterized protein n=1 Tax=Oedothorax gibbosus TaxID=931172 RepID=A0AAV6VUH2_9ARAC|nr:hypothetical protein JTE90_000853 [Oedothorax gibbosus]